jgi:hypothetical protein
MADPIYLVKDNQTAVRMEPTPYEEEAEFQDLIVRFPELLAGEQVDREHPRRWLLVKREIGIPDSESGGARWSLDHFFVDQDGIPTLVEVKRQSDTRLRREVVGQVLDYAANAARFWPSAYLQQKFEETCCEDGRVPGEVLAAFLESGDFDPTTFWLVVEGKLRDGEMRLIFVADEVPRELQRIVEFLNSQMTKTEVLAVEVTRYVGQGFSTHIPRLLGQTADAIIAKGPSRAGARRKWDESAFFAAAASQPVAVQGALRKLFALAKEPGFDFRFGTGVTVGSLNFIVPAACARSVVAMQTDGVLKLNFGWLPGNIQKPLATFARAEMKLTIPEAIAEGLVEGYPAIAPQDWIESTDALVAFLRRVQGEATT